MRFTIPRSRFEAINAILAPLGGVGAVTLSDKSGRPNCYWGAVLACEGLPLPNEINKLIPSSNFYNWVKNAKDPLVDQGFGWSINDDAVSKIWDRDNETGHMPDDFRVPLDEMFAVAGVEVVDG